MGQQNRDKKIKIFRLTLIEDETHKPLWLVRFSKPGAIGALVMSIVILLLVIYSLIAFTPIRTFIPGYPDARAKRAAIQNAIRIDSLETIVSRWELYSENLRRVFEGESPLLIDSLLENAGYGTDRKMSAKEIQSRDSLLRKNVSEEEQFELFQGKQRNLHIEGMHFFTPLKGVVSQGYDPFIHPFIDITAPANSAVNAVLDGTVISAGWNDQTGYTIQLQHSNDIISIYKHNQKLLKKIGDKVTAGSAIALVGNTGSLSTGDHLHFELWYKGEAVDPTQYINF